MSIKDQIFNKQLLKKWWFWVIVIILVATASVASGGKSKSDKTSNETKSTTDQTQSTIATEVNQQAVTYTITGGSLGELGKEVTLNKDSDEPNTEYLYKLPAGSYKVTTSFNKLASFFIVKDKLKIENGSDYPEVLDIVGSGYFLTSGDNDFNGRAKKEVVITVTEEESVQIVGTEKFLFEKQ